MNLIKRAGAWCNGEVAYLAWDVEKEIKGCVGFMVTRVHETGKDAGKRRILPTWIAFTDQNNPNWNEQDSSVWPIQNPLEMVTRCAGFSSSWHPSSPGEHPI